MPQLTANSISFNKKKLTRIAYILKAIAHPTRLAIVQLLGQYPKLSVNQIMSYTGCEQSLLSHHLNNMRLKGLLSSTREGQNILYTLKEKDLINIMACLEDCNCNM